MMEGGAHIAASFVWMHVCRLSVLVDVMICDSREKDDVFRPVVLYIGSLVLPNYVQVCHAFGDSVNANHHALHHPIGRYGEFGP